MSAKTATASPASIKVVFPELPYTELRTNFHGTNFWYKRAEVARIAREEAYLLAKRQVHLTKPIEFCEIEEVFTVPTKRRIDVEGLMGACKSWIDGLRDAGIILEDDWQHIQGLSGRVVYKKGVEQTEIIVSSVVS